MVLGDWDNVRDGAIELVVFQFIGTYINQLNVVYFKKILECCTKMFQVLIILTNNDIVIL